VKSRLSIVIISLVVLILSGMHCYLLDGLNGWIIGLIENTDTEYTAHYSDTKFRAVRKGASAGEVFELLGPPLRAWFYFNGTWIECPAQSAFDTNMVVSCDWSFSPSGGNYLQRRILFRKAKVSIKDAMFYID